MFVKIKQWIIKILLAVLWPLALLYWFMFRPKTSGVKCIIVNSNRILLVHHTYGKKLWIFPGGGMKRTEIPEEAARREIKEEVGLELSELKLLGSFINSSEYKIDTIYCILGYSENSELFLNTNEILEAKWFPIDSLPEISPLSRKILNLWKK